jgi:hypothetical protein
MSKKNTETPTQKLESLTKIALRSLVVVSLLLIALYALSLCVQRIPFPAAVAEFGQFGDFFGGVLNPIVSFFALMALWQTLKIQHEKEEVRENERLQQDDFNRKFDSYKEITAQITSQILYPHIANGPVVEGKAALAKWIEILSSEKAEDDGFIADKLSHLLRRLLKFNRIDLRTWKSHEIRVLCDFDAVYLLETDSCDYSIEGVGLWEDDIERVTKDSQDYYLLYSSHLIARLSSLISRKARLYELSTYFRAIHSILDSQLSYNNALGQQNIKFFRSQLNNAELYFIGLYILFNEKGRVGLAPVVKNSQLFKVFDFTEDEWLVDVYPNLIYILMNSPDYGIEYFSDGKN